MKIGIIGSGFGLYGLLPAFNSIKDCKVISICGKRTERLVSYCNSIGLDAIYSSWKDMLEQEDLDAVAIAVIPSAQYEIARYALQKGLHVFAEKPLAATYEQAEELASLARKKKLTTAIDFIFPEIEEWQKLKENLDNKTYGELKHISVEWDFLSYDIKNGIKSWKTDVKEGGGALSFYLSHTLYYLEQLVGPIVSTKTFFTYSKESKGRAETGVDSVFQFKNKVVGRLHFSCNNPQQVRHVISCVCEKATLILESYQGVTESFTLSTVSAKGKKNIVSKKTTANNKEDERVRIVRKLAARFVKASLTGSPMKPSMADGLRVQELITIIRKEAIKA